MKLNNTSDPIFDRFMEEWKMIYIPNVFVNNYIDIKYQKLNGLDVWSGIVHFPNKEPMLIFGTIFSVKFHCEMEDTIIKFPFDKHSCNIEVNCSAKQNDRYLIGLIQQKKPFFSFILIQYF